MASGGKNGKGCDFGYALAARSCEGACGVDACTVTALERSLLSQFQTPADISQRSRFFRVWRLFRLPGSNRSPGVLRAVLAAPPFSAVDGRKWLWLCPSRQLLRGSQRGGGMDRYEPRAITAFAGSEPRLTSRNAVGFFGSGGCSSRLDRTDHSAYFGAATYLLLSFSAVDESHFTLG